MRLKYIFLVFLQVLILAGIIAYRQYWVATGERVLLKTAPVDPRDIFRGDYVRLSYEISSLELEGLGVEEHFKPNEKVYVSLEKTSDDTYRATTVSKALPMGQTFIQGRVEYELPSSKWEVEILDDTGQRHPLKTQWLSDVKKGDRVTFCLDERGTIIGFYKEESEYKPKCRVRSIIGVVEEIKETKIRTLIIQYGIESYFVEEGKGWEIQSGRGAREIRVEISLRKDGKGIITGLFIGGTQVN